MKSKSFLLLLCVAFVFLPGCSDDDSTEPETGNGTLQLQTTLWNVAFPKIGLYNIDFMPDTIALTTLNLQFKITEFYVSKDEIRIGEVDDLEWIQILENSQLKFFDEYSFTVDLAPGEYNSLKIVFENRFYRLAAYQSNPSQAMMMEEYMCEHCDLNGLAPVNYFCDSGCNYLDSLGRFYVVNPNEKIGGLRIRSGETTTVTWKMNGPGTFDWIDLNENGTYEALNDTLVNFAGPPGVDTMWDFIVDEP